jgi:hypothetical protein
MWKVASALIFSALLVACSSNKGSVQASPPAAGQGSPAASLSDFNGQWCDAVLPLARQFDDLPTLNPSPRFLETVSDAVDRFDALASDLSQAGFSEEAAQVTQVADALDELLDAVEDVTPADITESLQAQNRALSHLNRGKPLDALRVSLGRCF